MAVKLSKLLFVILLFSNLSCAVNAKDFEVSRSEIISHAKEKVNHSQKELDETIAKCRDNLPFIEKQKINNYDLSNEELFTALFYLSDKAITECEKITWGSYIFELSVLRSIEKHYSSPVTKTTDHEKLLLNNYWRKIKLELEYLNIDQPKRALIENDDLFKKPFDAVMTAKKLGI